MGCGKVEVPCKGRGKGEVGEKIEGENEALLNGVDLKRWYVHLLGQNFFRIRLSMIE